MIKFAKVRTVKSPEKTYYSDAGYDFFVPSDFTQILQAGRSVNIPSGIKMEIPHGMVGVFLNKSSISANNHLIVGAQVVDHGYTGELHLNLFNIGIRPIEIKSEMKLTQLVLIPVYLGDLHETAPEYFNKKTERGPNGFGSTGV